MSRKYTIRDFINNAEKKTYPEVFYLQNKSDELKKSTSNYSNDRKKIHLEICVPNNNFKPYAILNTSNDKINEITILINDNTTNIYQTGGNKNKVLVLDFLFDNLQNSKIKPFNFKTEEPDEEVNIIIIHDKFDFISYEFDNNIGTIDKIKKENDKIEISQINKINGFYDFDGKFYFPEPKEGGEGVIIGFP